MRVLSLFDGISCGQLALERAGIEVDQYFASEINKNAIKVTMKNYPNTIQLGDVTQISKEWYLGMKEKGFKDEEIANDHLYVGKDVLKKWKAELGLKGFGRKDKKYVGN